MPELAEVEFMRRRWEAGVGEKVTAVEAHGRTRPFRRCDVAALVAAVTGAELTGSARSGKQMAFRFGEAGWLGLHLGMTGELRVEPPDFAADRHDHLVLRQKRRALVFNDPRQFGAVLFSTGAAEPAWWRDRPPEIVDRAFTRARVAEFLRRRARAPLKAVLLMQERFPGIGNWMADEVLWRARLNPARPAGALPEAEVVALFRSLRFVCAGALRSVAVSKGDRWSEPPRGWLFHQRWRDGGACPRDGAKLRRATVGGRTTCWCPRCQPQRAVS